MCGAKRFGGLNVCLARLLPGSGGAGEGVLSYQDTPQVNPCRLFLNVLSRTVLVIQYPSPASTKLQCIYQKPLTYDLRTEPRVGGTLLQDRGATWMSRSSDTWMCLSAS
jgi:hypothetical protein